MRIYGKRFINIKIKKMKQIVRTFLKNDEWKFILVRHNKRDYWTLPGGHVEDWENIYTAIKREIKEELNLEIKILWKKIGLNLESITEKPSPICIYKLDFENEKWKKIKKLEYIFLSEIKDWIIKMQDTEIEEYKFFTKEEILKLDNTFAQFKEIIQKI